LHYPRQTEGGLTRRTKLDRARGADICVLETDLPGGQYGMAEEFTEKLIEKVWEYLRLSFYAETVIFPQAFPLLIDFVHPPPSPFFFYNSVLTEEEVLPHRNWTF